MKHACSTLSIHCIVCQEYLQCGATVNYGSRGICGFGLLCSLLLCLLCNKRLVDVRNNTWRGKERERIRDRILWGTEGHASWHTEGRGEFMEVEVWD